MRRRTLSIARGCRTTAARQRSRTTAVLGAAVAAAALLPTTAGACTAPLTLPASAFGRGAAIDKVWLNHAPEAFGILAADHDRVAERLGATQRAKEQVVVGGNRLVLLSAQSFPGWRGARAMYAYDSAHVRNAYCEANTHDYGNTFVCTWHTTGSFYATVVADNNIEFVAVSAGVVPAAIVKRDVRTLAINAYARYSRCWA